MFVTFFDTCMVSLAAIFVWCLSPFIVFFPWLTIACLDCAFLSAVLTKVPDGAWFTISLAAVFAAIFLIWRFGKEQQWHAEAEDRFPTSHFVTVKPDHEIQLHQRFDEIPVSPIKGFGIFFDKAGETTPTVFSQFVVKLTAAPEIMVFFHLRPLETPSVAPEDRHTVSRLAIPNCYRLVVRYGFNDEIITPNLAPVIYDQIRQYILRDCQRRPISPPPSRSNDEKSSHHLKTTDLPTENPGATEELATLDRAFSHKTLYVIGKEQMKIKLGTNYFRLVLLKVFLWIRENSRNKMANMNVPMDKVVEVGFLKEI
jgi:KUP system potassium uptake protein